MDKVRVGIVGCGWFGNVHLDNLLKMERVQVTGLCGSSPEKRAAAAEKVPGVQTFNTAEEMFASGHVDAAFICIPPDVHGGIELAAAERKIHLYAEKPVELDLTKARNNEKALLEAGVVTSCGYHERYNNKLNALKEYLRDHPAGMVTGQWMGGMPGARWWRRKERSGGQAVEQCTHIFDLLRYFFGEAESVYALPVTGLIQGAEDCNIEDASAAVVRFENGLTASVQTACYFAEQAPHKIGLQIYCTDSRVEYDWMKELRYMTKDRTELIAAREESHFAAARAFIEAVLTGDTSGVRSSYGDGVKSLALTLAVNESMRTGLPVIL